MYKLSRRWSNELTVASRGQEYITEGDESIQHPVFDVECVYRKSCAWTAMFVQDTYCVIFISHKRESLTCLQPTPITHGMSVIVMDMIHAPHDEGLHV